MIENNHHLRLLEAILFASPQPLSPQMLYERMPAGADVGTLLQTLQSHYTGRGVQLINVDNHWAFRTAVDLATALSQEKEVARKLSRAAMETLAIIAYHQPITRAEIENIRGVATNRGTLDALMEMGWIKPGKRRETLGRPVTWVTTSGFLDHFALESVMDLPGMDEMKSSGLLDRRPAIETVGQDDLFSGQKRIEGVEGLSSATGADDEDDYEPDLEDIKEEGI